MKEPSPPLSPDGNERNVSAPFERWGGCLRPTWRNKTTSEAAASRAALGGCCEG